MSEPPKGNFPRDAEKLLKIKPPPSKKTQKVLDFVLKSIDKSADLCIIEA
tara:strand:- start:159 stop:308 length:150 start_codon:yes stop_codon:yes gene_type:complete